MVTRRRADRTGWTGRIDRPGWRAAAAGLAVVLVLCSGGAAAHRRGPVSRPISEPAARPEVRPVPVRAPVKLDRRRLTRALDRYLDDRTGSVSLMVRDLTTGNTYRYRAGHRYATASCAKVDILMTALYQAQKDERGLGRDQRSLADLSIRYSDNHAADRMWEGIGGASGMTAANRKFGLKHTRAIDGDCLGLHCWGITDTTVEEQTKLLYALVDDDSPLADKHRAYVLDLMTRVIKEQKWGISAAAQKGDKVALKNGWQKRTAHGGLWAINSIGRVQTPGHDLLIAVLSDHNPDTGYGITSVERVVEIAAAEFRKTSGRV